MNLAGRVALVTGASRGIGASVARRLAAVGARVVLVSRDRGALEGVAVALPASPALVVADLGHPDGADRVAREIAAWNLEPDLLVLNAGAFALGEVGALPLGTAEAMVDLNVRAPYRLLHHLLPGLRARGRGHVVTIGSVADHLAFPENGAYAMTKYGARGLHEVLRAELRGTGVRASLVSPGPVDTAIWDAIHPEARPGFPARAQMLRPDDVADAVAWAVTRPAHVNVDEVRIGHS